MYIFIQKYKIKYNVASLPHTHTHTHAPISIQEEEEDFYPNTLLNLYLHQIHTHTHTHISMYIRTYEQRFI